MVVICQTPLCARHSVQAIYTLPYLTITWQHYEVGVTVTSFGFFFFLVSICFLAALGFSCGMWDLSLQGTGFFLVVAHRLVCCGTCGILVP